jgi:hypothetical protein
MMTILTDIHNFTFQSPDTIKPGVNQTLKWQKILIY